MPFFVSRKKFESEISKRAIEAYEQAITQMGAEIHDNLLQELSPCKLYMHRMEESSTDPVEIEALLIQMRSSFEQATNTMKDTAYGLLLRRIENETLVIRLARLCREMEHPGIAHIHFTNEGDPTSMDESVEMHILRIVQELIQNAVKHSSAWHIWVHLWWQPEELIIEVEDDGSGFSQREEFIGRLKKKNNTLKMRTQAIGASIDYAQGKKGLLAKVRLYTNDLY
jgi:signal transduction histidine kinase